MNHRFARFSLAMISIIALAGFLVHRANARGLPKDITVDKSDQTTTIACNRDSIHDKSDHKQMTLPGECTKLDVSGDDNVINAATVIELEVSGDDNNITLDAAAKIKADGDDNNITWKKGVGGKAPDISSKGDDNKIKQWN